MNPRIYKKQAKRAVQLLRSHGDTTKYALSTEKGVIDEPFSWRRGQWLHKHRPAEYRMWQNISGIPEFHYMSFDESEGEDSRKGWICHYDNSRLPVGFWDGPEWDSGGKPWPRMTTRQRMNTWRYNQIAPGWKWRGGRAVKIAP